MKMTHIKSVSILVASLLLFAGCSDSSNDSVSASDMAKEADNSASKDELASGLASMQKQAQDKIAAAQEKADEQAAQLKAEVSAALAEQRQQLLSQMNANTSSLANQMTGLNDKYESLKGSLPDEVLKVVKEQIPDLETSINKLKEMAAKFDPNSIEELNNFKQKYQKEYEVAVNLMKKASELLTSSGVNMPKLF